jgi:hypothetical protein
VIFLSQIPYKRYKVHAQIRALLKSVFKRSCGATKLVAIVDGGLPFSRFVSLRREKIVARYYASYYHAMYSGAMHANYINQFSFEIFGLHQIMSGKTQSVLGGPACSLVCAWSAYNFVEWTMTDGWTYLSKTLTRMTDNPFFSRVLTVTLTL